MLLQHLVNCPQRALDVNRKDERNEVDLDSRAQIAQSVRLGSRRDVSRRGATSRHEVRRYRAFGTRAVAAEIIRARPRLKPGADQVINALVAQQYRWAIKPQPIKESQGTSKLAQCSPILHFLIFGHFTQAKMLLKQRQVTHHDLPPIKAPGSFLRRIHRRPIASNVWQIIYHEVDRFKGQIESFG